MAWTIALGRLAAAIACLASSAALAANLPLSARGPLSPVHPFPLWYQDASGVQAEPCLEANGCVLPATGVGGTFSAAAPIAYPANFPTSLVYGFVSIDVPVFDLSSGKVQQRGLIYTAQLTALFSAAVGSAPVVWTEIAFVTLGPGQFPPNQTYTIDHPYGTFVLASDATGNLCANRFQGGRNPCVIRFPAAAAAGTPFDGVLSANTSADPSAATLGTFLSQVGAPAGLLGDGVTRGGITGSPVGQNSIRISGAGVGTSPGLACTNGLAADCIEVGGVNPPKGQGFVVAGKRFAPAGGPTTQFWITDAATASPAGTIPRRDFATAAGTALTLTIRAVDVNGNLTAGYSGNVLLTSNDPGAALPAVATLTQGVGTFTFTPHQATAGALASIVSATDGVLSGSAVGQVDGGPATALLLTQTSPAVAGRPASFALRAVDQFGNVDTHFVGAVNVTSTDPAATVSNPVTLALGQGTFGATFRTAGSFQVAADGGPLLVPGVATVPVAPGPAASIAAAAGGGQSGAVGGPLAGAFTVVVRDAFGNVVPGVPVTFASPAGGGVSAAAATTDAGGLASSIGTLPTLPGAYVFSASSGALAGTPVSFPVTAVHGPPAALAMAGPATATAGVGVVVNLALADQFGNPCTTFDGSVTFTTTDPAGPPPLALVAGGLGSAVMVFHGAGPQTLAGSLAGSPAVSGGYSALVGAGAAVALSVTGLPATLAAGVTATLAVTALDLFQNVATGLSTALTVTSSDPSALLPGGAALSSGAATAQVAFRTTGTHTVTFTTPGGLSASASAAVTPAALASIAALSAPASGTVGAAAGLATFELRDTLGNVVAGKVVTFAAPQGGSVSPATATTDAQGRVSATLALPTATGSYAFTASAATFTATVTVAATAGPGHHFALDPVAAPSPVLDCGCHDLVAQLRDAFGNPVPSALGGVTASASASATLEAPTDLVATLTAPTASIADGTLQPDGSAHLHVCDRLPEHAAVTIAAPAASPPIAPASQDLGWTLGPADPAKTAALHLLSVDHATLVAWSGRSHVSFTPVSACGNPIGAGQPVSFALNGPGTLTPAVDVGDGSYTATLGVSPCPASGGTQVVARVGGVDVASVPVAVTCDPPDLAASTVAFSRRDVTMCDDPQRDLVTVTVAPRDAAGQLLGPGNTVVVSMDGLLGGAVRDAGDGTYTASFSAASCGPGPRQATVSVDGVDLASAALTFTCSPIDAGASGVRVTGRAQADGASALTVVVAATNDCGEPASRRPVVLTSTLGTLARASGTTDAAGTYTTTVTAAEPGQGTVTATVDGVALAPAALSFDPRPASGGCGTGSAGGLLALLGMAGAAARRLTASRRARDGTLRYRA